LALQQKEFLDFLSRLTSALIPNTALQKGNAASLHEMMNINLDDEESKPGLLFKRETRIWLERRERNRAQSGMERTMTL
jgi:hypothetical protein